jgi:GDPmannose 4,6-dehydratase
MWRMLQQERPEDFVLATGETRSVKEFIEAVFTELDMDLIWKGEKEMEIGISKKDGRTLVDVDPRYYRPTEVELLIGDATKAKEKLGWVPKVTFKELSHIMALADFEKVKKRGY